MSKHLGHTSVRKATCIRTYWHLYLNYSLEGETIRTYYTCMYIHVQRYYILHAYDYHRKKYKYVPRSRVFLKDLSVPAVESTPDGSSVPSSASRYVIQSMKGCTYIQSYYLSYLPHFLLPSAAAVAHSCKPVV